jgi:hypothetical protein
MIALFSFTSALVHGTSAAFAWARSGDPAAAVVVVVGVVFDGDFEEDPQALTPAQAASAHRSAKVRRDLSFVLKETPCREKRRPGTRQAAATA